MAAAVSPPITSVQRLGPGKGRRANELVAGCSATRSRASNASTGKESPPSTRDRAERDCNYFAGFSSLVRLKDGRFRGERVRLVDATIADAVGDVR